MKTDNLVDGLKKVAGYLEPHKKSVSSDNI